MDLYVRQQNVPQKSYMEILLMTLLDIAVYLSLDELLNLYKSKSFSVTEILSDADEATDSATYLLSLI